MVKSQAKAGTTPYWRDPKFMIPNVLAAVGVVISFVAIFRTAQFNVQLQGLVSSQQARASLSAAFRDFNTFLDRIPGAVRDSIEAGVNRAGRRGFTDPRGTAVGTEVLSGILPLGRNVADRWALVETEVGKTIANMGLPDTLLITVPALKDLHSAYVQLSSKKDSVVEAINVIERDHPR